MSRVSVLFASSVLNLTELIGLHPDLANYHKILYFHENQLNYPVRKHQERDFQYGYNQVLSCLVADEIVFNSKYNLDSFLNSIQSFFKLLPDYRPKHLSEKIRSRCKVLYFPLTVNDECSYQIYSVNSEPISEPRYADCIVGQLEANSSECAQELAKLLCDSDLSKPIHDTVVLAKDRAQTFTHNEDLVDCGRTKCVTQKAILCNTADAQTAGDNMSTPLHIVWPHRWEHDKGPDLFFNTLRTLKQEGFEFRLSVLGESFNDVPDIFEQARVEFEDSLLHWGFQNSRKAYLNILSQADLVISTAEHEFFGVAMLEAVLLGCYPCCPNKLVYPEIFPERYLYNTNNQLLKMLKKFCRTPSLVRQHKIEINVSKYCWSTLKQDYLKLLKISNVVGKKA